MFKPSLILMVIIGKMFYVKLYLTFKEVKTKKK